MFIQSQTMSNTLSTLTQYTIYLVNSATDGKTFWCFLQRPEELTNSPNVFANSSANLFVLQHDTNVNRFVIPVQYSIEAGASNNAVGLNVKVESTATQETDLGKVWKANYATVPPQEGPHIKSSQDETPSTTIAIESNNFDKAQNQQSDWYSSMSFGIRTEAGFMGMTWSPSPQDKTTLTPKLTFYVSTGSFDSNTLASWDTVSTDAVSINAPNDFDQSNQATVTLTNTGSLIVTSGAPSSLPSSIASEGQLDKLIESNLLLSTAHSSLVALAQLDSSSSSQISCSSQTDKVTSVKWVSDLSDLGNTHLTGTITVAAALAVAFGFFVLAGVKFTVDKVGDNGTTVHFSYSGTRGAQEIKELLVAGASALFSNNPQ